MEVFLRHLSFCRRKAFYEDGYNKINELDNYTGSLISRLKTLRDKAMEFRFQRILSEKMEVPFR